MPTSLTIQQFIQQENIITGEQAVILSGMQNTLLEEITAQNQYFANITTFMVSDPDNFPPFNSSGVPKPSSIHSKTSSVVGGYIPVDPIFTRLDPERKPLGHHYHDNLELQESVQVKWTLWEILKRCGINGDLCMDWPNGDSPIVRFQFKDDKGPLGFTGCFQLDLGQEKPNNLDPNQMRVVTRYWDDPKKYLNLVPDKIRESFSGSGDDILRIPYKIFYNSYKNALFKPLMVFAYNGKPIIGDWDKDMESMPLLSGILDLKEANMEFNTFIITRDKIGISQQIKLIEATKKLFINLLYKDQIFQDLFNECFLLGLDKNSPTLVYDVDNLFYLIAIKTSLLERAGCITPYEFLRNALANHVHNLNNQKKGLSGYFSDPFQHGVAQRSPFFSFDKTISGSNDGPRFHIFSDQNNIIYYIYTFQEEQRINFYLTESLLEKNFIHISPFVNMGKWHPVISKQIELGQQELIHPATLLAYKKHQKYVPLRITIEPVHIKNTAKTQADSSSSSNVQQPKKNKLITTFLKFTTAILSIGSQPPKEDQEVIGNDLIFNQLTTDCAETIDQQEILTPSGTPGLPNDEKSRKSSGDSTVGTPIINISYPEEGQIMDHSSPTYVPLRAEKNRKASVNFNLRSSIVSGDANLTSELTKESQFEEESDISIQPIRGLLQKLKPSG